MMKSMSSSERLLLPAVAESQVETEVSVETVVDNLRTTCDTICTEHPDNFLFFTKYGGSITQEKFEKDKRTDLDLRLVCFTIPPIEEQQKIANRLRDESGGIPVELYFHSYEKYIKGEVGETGDKSVLECMRQKLNPESVNTTITHPSMISLYTYSTMEFFTNRKDTLQEWITSVADTQLSWSNTENTTLSAENMTVEALSPDAILEKIKLDREGIIEWVHLYLRYFLADYREFQALSKEKQQDPNELYPYLKRISKYLLRIAYGVAVVESDLEDIKEKYVQNMKFGLHADQNHFEMISYANRSWRNDSTQQTLNAALELRAYAHEFSIDQASPLLLTQSLRKIENTILYLTQQSGGMLRREEFGEVHDFLTEVLVVNLLTPIMETDDLDTSQGNHYESYAEGETLIREGDHPDELLIIPDQMRSGSENGDYAVVVDGEELKLNRLKVILGELGILLGAPRSTSIIAKGELEALVVKSSFLTSLFTELGPNGKETLLRYFLSSHIDAENSTIKQDNKFLLTFALLNYFSSEFVQYLYERVEYGYAFSEKEGSDTKASHMLSSYKLEHFSETFLEVAKTKKITLDYPTNPPDSTPKKIFEAGSNNNTYIYVVTACEPNGGVKLTFSGDTDDTHATILKKHAIFGESSLLPGSKPHNYSAILLPGTKITRIKAQDFQKMTMTTDILPFSFSDESTQEKIMGEITGIELFFHLGVSCLDRLQQLQALQVK